MIFVNADGLALGRVASYSAKKALQGEEIVIVNAEKAVITGSKKALLERFHKRAGLSAKGNPRKGPKAVRMPDRILRAAVTGMLPVKRRSGRDALKRVIVFITLPEKFKEKEFVDLEEFRVDERKSYVLVGDISKLMGAKW